MYDYFLGGVTNTAAERAAAESVRAKLPEAYDAAWANRGFLQRAVRWLADQGVRQFIDLGAGLPTQNPTHEVVRGTGARVVYVDSDPRVAELSLPLLRDVPGATAITADLREPAALLPRLDSLLDLDQPVALLMVAVLHFVADRDNPWAIVRRYLDALAPGSYLALSHGTVEHQPEEPVKRLQEVYNGATEQIFLRTRVEVERFFTDLDLVRPHPGACPAVTYVGMWAADDPETADSEGSRWSYCGVARLP
jgi:O-methyltransferase involved in polyketide biosynthesis